MLCVCCSQCCWARIIPSMGFVWILAPAPGAPDLSESSQCHGDVQSLRTEPAAASALSFPQHLCCGTWQQRGKLLGATDAEELGGKAGIQQPLWVTGREVPALLKPGLRAAGRCSPGLAQSALPLSQDQKPWRLSGLSASPCSCGAGEGACLARGVIPVLGAGTGLAVTPLSLTDRSGPFPAASHHHL